MFKPSSKIEIEKENFYFCFVIKLGSESPKIRISTMRNLV